MAIYLKNEEVNPYEKNTRFTCVGEPREVVHEDKVYKELTYVKKLNGIQCFGRGLAWALGYLTIIPIIFCRARLQELFREAREKKETKIVRVESNVELPGVEEVENEEALEPQAIKSAFRELKNQIALIKRKPTFIDDLVEAEPSQENNNALKKWIEARNTIVFWEGLCEQLNILKDNLSITEFESIDKTVEKALKFKIWFIEHQDKIKALTSLTTLQGKQLTHLPKQINAMPHLVRLDLQDNLLITLPAEISQLKKLNRLDLRNNLLTTLPTPVYQLKELTHLYLGKNKITALPPQIGRLGTLVELNLAQNRLQRLPKEMGHLRDLKILVTEGNPIDRLPQEVKELIDEGKLKCLLTSKETREKEKAFFTRAKEAGVKIERPETAQPQPKNDEKAHPEKTNKSAKPQPNGEEQANLEKQLKNLMKMQMNEGANGKKPNPAPQTESSSSSMEDNKPKPKIKKGP
jgi:hypothetical protein